MLSVSSLHMFCLIHGLLYWFCSDAEYCWWTPIIASRSADFYQICLISISLIDEHRVLWHYAVWKCEFKFSPNYRTCHPGMKTVGIIHLTFIFQQHAWNLTLFRDKYYNVRVFFFFSFFIGHSLLSYVHVVRISMSHQYSDLRYT